ncbi:MAG: DUF445 family protein [Clostridia bacterium]|nr:DUF445 family protein [Clostridia bacterium]
MNWETVQTILHYISGPIIGALIGYITNYIAVKMLFHPYYPIKIFGFTLPFTPGIIPKRKGHLAKAIARAVGEKLFTEEDLKAVLCSDDIKATVTNAVCDKVDSLIIKSPKEISLSLTNEEGACKFKDKVCNLVAEKVVEGAKEMDVGALIAEKGFDVIKEKKSSMGMIGLFITDDLISSVLEQLKEKVNEFIETEGIDVISEKAKGKIDSIFDSPLADSIDFGKIDRSIVQKKLSTAYEQLISRALDSIKGKISISDVVEKKVNAMSVKELEALCLSVMKRELGAVINLGALIGFVIGIVNIFI